MPSRPRPEISDTPLETTWEDVWEVALQVALSDPADRRHTLPALSVSMDDKVSLIVTALAEKVRVEFSRLLCGFEDKTHAVMTLLAGLELSRRRELFLRQVTPFSELWLYRRREDDAGPLTEGREPALEEPEIPRGTRRRPSWMPPEEEEPEDPLAVLDLDSDDQGGDTMGRDTT